MIKPYYIEYQPILSGPTRRYFGSWGEADTWRKQIGRPRLKIEFSL